MCIIAILDQFTLFGSGIRSILKEANQNEVVIEASSPNKLIASLGTKNPDVIIFDVLHDENSGIGVVKRLSRTFASTPILLILNKNYSDSFEEYIRLGVKGFVFHNSTSRELLLAINRLKNGKEYFASKVWDIFRSSIRARKPHRKVEEHHLTDREMAILKLFSRGMSYKEIGASLNISPRTVETHKRNILSKLKINSTAGMIRYAYQNNLLP